jgi:hypothetical protein
MVLCIAFVPTPCPLKGVYVCLSFIYVFYLAIFRDRINFSDQK